MPQQSIEPLPKFGDRDITDEDIALARDLIRHHRHAFDVRCVGLLEVEVDPPEVRELTNLLVWIGNGYSFIDVGRHVVALSGIVSNNAKELREMIEYIKRSGIDTHSARRIEMLRAQMESADTLMGYLTNE